MVNIRITKLEVEGTEYGCKEEIEFNIKSTNDQELRLIQMTLGNLRFTDRDIARAKSSGALVRADWNTLFILQQKINGKALYNNTVRLRYQNHYSSERLDIDIDLTKKISAPEKYNEMNIGSVAGGRPLIELINQMKELNQREG